MTAPAGGNGGNQNGGAGPQPPGTFKADSVLAKHDEKYMPKEVADALKQQGLWKDDSGKQVGAAPPGRTP